MDFKENVINFFSILVLFRGPVACPSRARLACGTLIEDLCSISMIHNLQPT